MFLIFFYGLTEKKEEDTSLIARLGLNDWKFALPIGLFVGIPALSNQVCTETHYLNNVHPFCFNICWQEY